MNVKLLIDAIMRQTTVLIAQLSTMAGVRAPLAHIADQVFVSLAKEIEAQGVARKVVADMFGLALRGYQKKTQRIAGSQTEQGKTLFEAVLEYLDREQAASKESIVTRFRRDGERETIGVLTDLVTSGLVHVTGKGSATLYGPTSHAERQRLTRMVDRSTLADMVWGSVYRAPGITSSALLQEFQCSEPELRAAIELLTFDGRVQAHVTELETGYTAATFRIAPGAEYGWESAVFDHFQAVATAIAQKLELQREAAEARRIVGGSTLRFELGPDHPHRERVIGLLEEVRELVNRVWEETCAHNDAHPLDPDARFNVTFYFGQGTDDVPAALGRTSMDDVEAGA